MPRIASCALCLFLFALAVVTPASVTVLQNDQDVIVDMIKFTVESNRIKDSWRKQAAFFLASAIQDLPADWKVPEVANVCSWAGVECANFTTGDVTELRVINIAIACNETMKVTGTIPSSIARLDKLVSLSLGGCDLHGVVTPDLWKLEHLERLILNDNTFTGTIPNELGQKLNFVSIRLNNFYGTLPGALGQLPNLESFYADNNLFECPLPFELLRNLTRHVGGVFTPRTDEGDGSCQLWNNQFHVENSKLCGTIPFGLASCIVAPFRTSLPRNSLVESKGSFHSRRLRIDVEGNTIAVLVKNDTKGAIVDTTYIVWEFKSYAYVHYWAPFDGFILPLQYDEPTKASIVGRFADGREFKFYISLTHHGGTEGIKIGFGHHSFPAVPPPYWADFRFHVTQFIKSPLDKDDLFNCGPFDSGLIDRVIDNGLQETEAVRCAGSEIVFRSTINILDPWIGPSISFGLETAQFNLSFVWALSATVDDSITAIRNDGVVLYTENLIPSRSLRNALRLNTPPLPKVQPLPNQWLAIALEFELDTYNRTFLYDPDIRLDSIFDFGDESELNVAGLVVGILVGALVLGALIASLAVPSVRRKVYPFLTRKEKFEKITVEPTPSASADATWHNSTPRNSELHNTKTK